MLKTTHVTQQQITEAETALEKVHSSVPFSNRLEDYYAPLQSSLKQFPALRQAPLTERAAFASNLHQQLQLYFSAIADASNLAFDPEVQPYYLQKAILEDIPFTRSATSQLAHATLGKNAIAVETQYALSVANLQRLIFLFKLIEKNLTPEVAEKGCVFAKLRGFISFVKEPSHAFFRSCIYHDLPPTPIFGGNGTVCTVGLV